MRILFLFVAFVISASLFSQEPEKSAVAVSAGEAHDAIVQAERKLVETQAVLKEKSDKAATFEGQLTNLDQSIKKLTADRKLLQMQYKTAVNERNTAKQQVAIAKEQLKTAKKQLKLSLKEP
jgi:septal ring factor EnvC (AmiA/AmiB activator)